MATRTPHTDADATDYVECSECGCPVEVHRMVGCTNVGCSCGITWTKTEIRNYRRTQGLPRTSFKWGL